MALLLFCSPANALLCDLFGCNPQIIMLPLDQNLNENIDVNYLGRPQDFQILVWSDENQLWQNQDANRVPDLNNAFWFRGRPPTDFAILANENLFTNNNLFIGGKTSISDLNAQIDGIDLNTLFIRTDGNSVTTSVIPFVQGLSSAGQLTVTHIPTGTTSSTSSLVINPVSASPNTDLIWAGVNDVAVFRLDEDGDILTGTIETQGSANVGGDLDVADDATFQGHTIVDLVDVEAFVVRPNAGAPAFTVDTANDRVIFDVNAVAPDGNYTALQFCYQDGTCMSTAFSEVDANANIPWFLDNNVLKPKQPWNINLDANLAISGATKNDKPHLLMRAEYVSGFDTFKSSEIQFFKDTEMIGRIWYKDTSGASIPDRKGLHFETGTSGNIIFDADGGNASIVFNGETIWEDDVKILIGKPALGDGRFEFYATDNQGFLNPLNWGIGDVEHPDSFTYNAGLEDTDFVFNGTDENVMCLDAGSNFVGIGTCFPQASLDVNGNVNVDGNISFDGAYAEMYQNHLDTQVNFTAVHDFNGINGMTFGDSSNFVSKDLNVFVVQLAGDYLVNWSISFSAGGNNKSFGGAPMVNDMNVDKANAHRFVATGQDIGNMGATGVLDLSVGNKVVLGAVGLTDTTEMIIEHANMTLTYIGR